MLAASSLNYNNCLIITTIPSKITQFYSFLFYSPIYLFFTPSTIHFVSLFRLVVFLQFFHFSYIDFSLSIIYSMKPGKGNKDNDQIDNIRSELEQKKKENLQLCICLQSLQAHNATLVQENMKLIQDNKDAKYETETLIDNQKFHISILEDRNRQILLQKRDLQIKHDTLKITYDGLTRQFNEFRLEKELQLECLRKKYEDDVESFQISQNKYNSSIFEYEKLLKEVGELRSMKESEQEAFKVKIANIQRQKIQSIDCIKKDMLTKACQMRNKALEIRKQQLQVTTRLTFLQNDQLIRELEFQSAKTEEILKKNTQLEAEVKELKRSVEVHQEVEKQLMKRNVGAKNIITTLNQKMKKMTQQPASKSKNPISQNQQEDSQQNKKKQSKKEMGKSIKKTSEDANKNLQQEDIQVLKEYIKNMQPIHENQVKQNQILKKECQNLQQQVQDLKIKMNSQNCDNVATLMVRFLQQIIMPLKGREESQSNKQVFDMKSLKQVKVQKWSVDNLQKIVKIILNELRPYLSLKILKMAYFESSLENKPEKLDYESMKQNLHVSKYLQALKRNKDRSIENIKSRSVSYIVEDKRQPLSQHRKISTIKNKQVRLLEPVGKRFTKPELASRLGLI